MPDYDYSQINRRHIAYHSGVKAKIIPFLLISAASAATVVGINQSYKKTFIEPRAASDRMAVVESQSSGLTFVTKQLPNALVAEPYSTEIVVSTEQPASVQIQMPTFPGIANWTGECKSYQEEDGLFYTACPFSGIPDRTGDFDLSFSATTDNQQESAVLKLSVFEVKATTP